MAFETETSGDCRHYPPRQFFDGRVIAAVKPDRARRMTKHSTSWTIGIDVSFAFSKASQSQAGSTFTVVYAQ
jgi:hypothetical protein